MALVRVRVAVLLCGIALLPLAFAVVVSSLPPPPSTTEELLALVGNDTGCDFLRLAAPPSLSEFVREHRGRAPVVWARRDGAPLAGAVTRAALARSRAEMPVLLSSSNSYSHDKRTSTMGAYLAGMRVQSVRDLANETFTLFGDTHSAAWDELLAGYTPPPFALRDEPGASQRRLACFCDGAHSAPDF